MPVGNEILTRLGGRRPRAIADDRFCRSCQYNLKGLDSARCPECGTPVIAIGRDRFGDTLTDAPHHYLRALATACTLGALCALAGTISLLVAIFGEHSWAAFGCAAISLGWAFCVHTLCAPRQSTTKSTTDPNAELRRTRLAARISQWLWTVGGLCIATALIILDQAIAAAKLLPGIPTPVLGPSFYIFYIAGLLFFLAAFAGLTPLCVQLALLSDWAGNSSLSERLRTALWLLAFAIIVLIPTSIIARVGLTSPFGFIVSLGLIFGWGALVIGAALFLISLINLATMANWAVANSIAAMERDSRIADRVEKERRAALEREYNAPPPVNIFRAADEKPDLAAGGQRIDRRPDTAPYEIDPNT
jgi:hypothetical protein